LGAAACKEEGGVKVKSLKFEGLEAVEPGQLKSVLATGASSRLPWGERRYFSREGFEADMKRIVAFYRDRGFPDARVASFDVDLSEDQTAVDITVRISEEPRDRARRIEGERLPVRVGAHFREAGVERTQQRHRPAGNPWHARLPRSPRDHR
jgi:outer membrane protein assembly factor BamA